MTPPKPRKTPDSPQADAAAVAHPQRAAAFIARPPSIPDHAALGFNPSLDPPELHRDASRGRWE